MEPHDGTGRVQLSFTVLDGQDRDVRVPPGVSVFDSASWNGIAIDSTCGGHGTCHKCKVRLDVQTPISRHDRRTFSESELGGGWRLACLATATQDLKVEVPPLTTRPKAATVGVGRQVILRPAVQKRYVELDDPTLADQRTDLARLTDAIDDLELTVDLPVLRRLPKVLREADFKVTAVVVDEALIDVEPGDTTDRRYAIAFDLGTTTVVATLLDLGTGTPVAVASRLNKQQPFGGDVITRISATMMDPEALGRLQSLAGETLDELAQQVCTEGGVDPAHVYEVAIAGNATMTALALGIDPEPLGVAPFVQTTSQPPVVLAAEVGLHLHPRARAAMFPALGAYVGGDIVAGMLATGMDRDKRTRLFIDVGTNCEIVLSNGDTIVLHGRAGRAGLRGRCDPLRHAGGRRRHRGGPDRPRTGVELAVIGDVEPRGLCGSGLVDAVGRARQGRAARPQRTVHHRRGRRSRSRRSSPTGSSGSVRSGCSCCTARPRTPTSPTPSTSPSATCVSCSSARPRSRPAGRCCSSSSDSSRATSSRSCSRARSAPTSRRRSAVRIGLVPKLPVLRIVSAGNVAGEGAKMILLSLRERDGAATLLKEVEYVELSDRADFNDRFVDLLAFPWRW